MRAKSRLETQVLTPEIRENKQVVKGVVSVVDMTKAIRSITKELEVRRAEVERLEDQLQEKDKLRNQSLRDLGMLIRDMQNQVLEEEPRAEQIFLGEGQEVENYRREIGEVVKILRFLYCFDPIEQPGEEYQDLIEE
mgnify:CR=1 FL=1